MCTPRPVSAFRYAGSVATRVLPSPVAISAIVPSCSTMPPMSCTSKWRIRTRATRRLAARGEGLGQEVVELLAAGEPLAELVGLGAERRVVDSA